MNTMIIMAAENVNFFAKTWDVFVKYQPLFLNAIRSTLLVAFVGTIAGLLIGLLIGAIRAITSGNEVNRKPAIRIIHKVIYAITGIYVEVFRGTPMMVQAMFLHYTLFAPIFHWSPITSAMVIISVNTGAYMAEIVRSGIQAVENGQLEGARTIGMTSLQTMRYIVLPQAIKNSFPSIGNEFVVNIKDSCVLNCIQFSELFFVAKSVQGSTFSYAEPFLIVGIIYLVLTFVTSRILGYIEKRLNHKRSSYPASVTTPDSGVLKG